MNRKLKVFLCHSSNDKPAVRELYQRLKSEGWIDPWLDEEKLYPGQDWDREIEIAVEESESVLILLSKESVEKESYVQYELRSILHIAKYKPAGVIFVLPLRINDCAVPRSLKMWQHIDYFPKNRKDWAYQRILGSLKMRAAKLGIDVENIIAEKKNVEQEQAKEERRKKIAAERARKERVDREKKETTEKVRKDKERIGKREQEKVEKETLEKARKRQEAREKKEAEEKARIIAAVKARKNKGESERKATTRKVRQELGKHPKDKPTNPYLPLGVGVRATPSQSKASTTPQKLFLLIGGGIAVFACLVFGGSYLIKNIFVPVTPFSTKRSPTEHLATFTSLPPTFAITPQSLITFTPTIALVPTIGIDSKEPTIVYYSQSGDYLEAVAVHFGVEIREITSTDELPNARSLINPNTLLVIPDKLEDTTSNEQIFPDSEIIFSVTGADFDTLAYVAEVDGYLNDYEEYLGSTGWTSGAEGIARLAQENSFNPRLLMALVEYESGWVLGQPSNLSETDYPLGYIDSKKHGLFRQMMRAVQDLSLGYYGWREGSLTELTFPDGTTKRIAPDLNAGSVAIQYYFAKKMDPERWAQAVDPRVGFPALYEDMFGNPWERAQHVEPLFPNGLVQPDLVLPFEVQLPWFYTGAPHSAWEHEGALAALDFTPNDSTGCSETSYWVVASAPGLVVRSDNGVVMLDLDGDGLEETGWSLLYLHVATEGRVSLGAWVEVDDRLGQPSCEGGVSTGTHLHFARKYNGEWILADGPLPFNLDGWIAHNGEGPYLGILTRGNDTITAGVVGDVGSTISRDQ